jgi:hypothetical protein
MRHFCLLVLACAALALCAPSLAAAGPSGGDSSSAALACQQGGFVNFVRSDGSTFGDTGDCVSYAALGGTLVPVDLNASFVADPSRTPFEDLTLTGSGLEPGSTVSYSFIPVGQTTRSAILPTLGNNTVASDGSFVAGWQTGCPLDNSFEFFATTAYGLPITATGC